MKFFKKRERKRRLENNKYDKSYKKYQGETKTDVCFKTDSAKRQNGFIQSIRAGLKNRGQNWKNKIHYNNSLTLGRAKGKGV